MAVLLEGFCLVVRNSTLEARSEGVAAFLRSAPTRAVCTDGRVTRMGFMSYEDMERHRAKLEATGLGDRQVGDEVVVVRANDPRDVPVWLGVGRYGGCIAAWLVDHDPEPLVVPVSWRPGAWTLLPQDSIERLELVNRENAVDVYKDKSTGRSVSVTRSADAPAALDEGQVRRLQALYEQGSSLVSPYLQVAEGSTASPHSWWARRRIKKGIRLLESVVKARPLWNAHWIMGMAFRALGGMEQRLASLQASYELNPGHADVAREYVDACLAVGRGEEAVRAATYNCKLHPTDAGLRANLGLPS